jgi:hypothetical protein
MNIFWGGRSPKVVKFAGITEPFFWRSKPISSRFVACCWRCSSCVSVCRSTWASSREGSASSLPPRSSSRCSRSIVAALFRATCPNRGGRAYAAARAGLRRLRGHAGDDPRRPKCQQSHRTRPHAGGLGICAARGPRLRPFQPRSQPWDLTDPIVIETRKDLKSEKRWQERLQPYDHQVTNLITFCRRLPVTLLNQKPLFFEVPFSQ